MAAANFNIPPPAKFDPKTDDWDHWIKRYELFEAATERDELSDKLRIDTLICLLADVSYFLCCTRKRDPFPFSACNKGNRRRLHAGNTLIYVMGNNAADI